jgi:hypothetical protein
LTHFGFTRDEELVCGVPASSAKTQARDGTLVYEFLDSAFDGSLRGLADILRSVEPQCCGKRHMPAKIQTRPHLGIIGIPANQGHIEEDDFRAVT